AEGTRSAGVTHFRITPELSECARHEKRQTKRYRCAPQLAIRLRPWFSRDARRVGATARRRGYGPPAPAFALAWPHEKLRRWDQGNGGIRSTSNDETAI